MCAAVSFHNKEHRALDKVTVELDKTIYNIYDNKIKVKIKSKVFCIIMTVSVKIVLCVADSDSNIWIKDKL